MFTTAASEQTTTQNSYKRFKYLEYLKDFVVSTFILVLFVAVLLSIFYLLTNAKVDKSSAVSEIAADIQTVSSIASSEEKTDYLVGAKKLLAQDSIRKWDVAMNNLRYRKAVAAELQAKTNRSALVAIEEVDKQLMSDNP